MPTERRLLSVGQQIELANLQRLVDVDALRVHQITGRTDQSLSEIVRLHPDHEHVTAYLKAVARRDHFMETIQ